MKVIRYADVLLMMAEAEANRSGGSLTTAIGYMNQVRARADVDLPLYGSAAMNAIYPVSNLAEFMVALEHERKVELCGEQVRFSDLVRWGRLAAFMTEVKPSCPKADQAALVFNPPKNYLWPIPQKEIDVNPNIEQDRSESRLLIDSKCYDSKKWSCKTGPFFWVKLKYIQPFLLTISPL